MREALFAGVVLYALFGLAGAVGSFALLFSRHRWLVAAPIMAGFVAAAMAPGPCEHPLPAGVSCVANNPGGGGTLYFVRGLFWGMLGAWALRAALGVGRGAEAEPREISATLQVLGLVGVLAFGGAAVYLVPRETILGGAREFVAAAPQVIAAVGRPGRLALTVVRRHSGKPEMPIGYREYEFNVSGDRGTAHVTVRIRDTKDSRYELVSVR